MSPRHAGSWQPTLSSLVSHNNPTQRDGMIGGFQMGWPVVVEQFADLIPSAALEMGEKMPGAIPGLLDKMCSDPVSLTHAAVAGPALDSGQKSPGWQHHWQ